MNFYTEDLLKLDPYGSSDSQKNIFLKSVKQEIEFHLLNNEPYKIYFDKKKKLKSFSLKDIDSIPFVPVQIFKYLGDDLSSVEKKYIKASLQSSSTSGKPSKVLIDKITSRRQVKAMSKVLGDFIGMNRRKFHILDVNPATKNNIEISARGAAAMGFLNFSSGADYHLTINDNATLDFNLKIFEKNILNNNSGEPPVIFGFTYV